MNIFSKCLLTSFELLNELFIAVGSGAFGIAVLLNHGYNTSHFMRSLVVVSISIGSLVYACQTYDRRKPSKNHVVFITGCDSGLGFSFAQHAAHIGLTVIAGFLNLDSSGAKEILNLNLDNIKNLQIDITDRESVHSAARSVEHFFKCNPDYELHAVVNNAGIMVFGEFEWQTDHLIQKQINVNLYGTFLLSKHFMPLLRQYKGRLINVCSHCSLVCLPGLTVYGSTKAGLLAFGDGLRMEVEKYGVKVISFIPGSFFSQSNIMARHPQHVEEMHAEFTEEQHSFYGDYFQRYHGHLLGLNAPKIPQKIGEHKLYKTFEDALLMEFPKAVYKVEPPRYAIYHFLFKYSPILLIKDYFVTRFMSMPEYTVSKEW